MDLREGAGGRKRKATTEASAMLLDHTDTAGSVKITEEGTGTLHIVKGSSFAAQARDDILGPDWFPTPLEVAHS